jgi:arylsulfatase A
VDGKKSNLTEGGSRVPLIASWPGTTPAGSVCPDLVDFSDMLPTFAELAGAKLPADRTLDGHSFAPRLRGQAGEPRDWVYVHLGGNRYIRSDRWKLTGSGEFFDMSDAPFRQAPVAADAMSAEAKAERVRLQTALDKLISADGSAASQETKKERNRSGKARNKRARP